MAIPLQITFRNFSSGGSTERQIRRRFEALTRHYPRITAGQVVLESRSRRRQQGDLFNVRVALAVPGRVIAINRTPGMRQRRADPRVAIRDAFNAARRALSAHAWQLRGDVKAREGPPTGQVSWLSMGRGFGFLTKDTTGEEVYFHRNSVVNDGFSKLRSGQRVRYALSPDPGDKGAQASTVVPF